MSNPAAENEPRTELGADIHDLLEKMQANHGIERTARILLTTAMATLQEIYGVQFLLGHYGYLIERMQEKMAYDDKMRTLEQSRIKRTTVSVGTDTPTATDSDSRKRRRPVRFDEFEKRAVFDDSAKFVDGIEDDGDGDSDSDSGGLAVFGEENVSGDELNADIMETGDEEMPDTFLGKALEFIEANKENPFFLLQHRSHRVPIVEQSNFQRVSLWTPSHHRLEQWTLSLEVSRLSLLSSAVDISLAPSASG